LPINGPSPNDKAARKTQLLVYKALIGLKSMRLELDGERLALGAGMQTNAEILLGTRTVMEFLLSPVRKAWHEAERKRQGCLVVSHDGGSRCPAPMPTVSKFSRVRFGRSPE